MDENMRNDELMEATEDLVPRGGSNLGGKLIVGALVAGGIFAAYKLVQKFKSKKEETNSVPVAEDSEEGVIDAEIVEELNKKLN